MRHLCRIICLLSILVSPFAAAEESEVTPQAIESAITKGVDFLLADQNEDGSWGSPRQTKGLNIYAPVPGSHHAFRTAVTAMAVSAIIESGRADSSGPVAEALERGIQNLYKELPQVRRANADAIYNIWTHAYGLQTLALLYERSDSPAEKIKIRNLIQGQINRLNRFESIDGGWGYYDFVAQTAKPSGSSISFTTATVLVAFKEVESIESIELSERIVKRAIAAINRQRKSDLSYMYGEYLKSRPMYGINRPGGSLGRSQACNYALKIWGDTTIREADIEDWLDKLDKRNGWLDIGRKRPVPHESWFAVAGYFYYYGHYYAAKCTELLPDGTASPFKEMLAGLMLKHQEKDGSWWDFPFYSYHQPYGTAFALMTLSRCRP
ncbi:MAG: terpene cyclase/mutase family protein [Verrucomicrobiales bacterium]|nr:terpene cyclase/mutase family protein [Verrucomicrobiales bacterium]